MKEVLVMFQDTVPVVLELKNGKLEYVQGQSIHDSPTGMMTTVRAMRITPEGITSYNHYGIPEAFPLSKICALSIMKRREYYPLPHEENMLNSLPNG